MTSTPHFDIGDAVVLRATFSVTNTLTNPASVIIRVRPPSGAESNVSTTNPSPGVYQGIYTPTQAGTHWWKATGTSPAQAVQEKTFEVRNPRVIG
jgi:hypothetical protein